MLHHTIDAAMCRCCMCDNWLWYTSRTNHRVYQVYQMMSVQGGDCEPTVHLLFAAFE
jgi:hypothetical protein